MTRHHLAPALGLVALALSACGAPAAAPAKAAPPPLRTVTAITDPGQVTRPIDGYLATADQVREIFQAEDAVTSQCVRGYGLTPRGFQLLGLQELDSSRRTRGTLYGFFDPATARSRGYAGTVVATPPPARPGDAPLGPPSADLQTAMTGHDPVTGKPVGSLNGRPLPAGGCTQRGHDALGDAEARLGESGLPDGGPKTPPDDPRLTAAYAAWSTCMQGKGYHYHDPIAAIADQKWHPSHPNAQTTTQTTTQTTASAEEIATATADVECKITGNTVGVITAVQSAYDQRYIDTHAAQLAAYQRQYDELLKRAAQLVQN